MIRQSSNQASAYISDVQPGKLMGKSLSGMLMSLFSQGKRPGTGWRYPQSFDSPTVLAGSLQSQEPV